MKKIFKFLLIFVAIVALLLIVAAVVVTRPGFQKSIFLNAMDGKVDAVQVETLSAGLSNVKIDELKIEQNGAIIELGSLNMAYSLLDIALKKEIRIDNLSVNGLLVDLRNQKPAATKPKPESGERGFPEFAGIFENAEVPAKVFVGSVNIEGKVLAPDRQMTFNASGGDIAPGKTGAIKLKGQLDDRSENAAAETLTVDATLTLEQTLTQKLNRIELAGNLGASGGALSQPAKLNLTSVATREKDAEKYQLTVKTGGKQIAELESTFTPATELLKGQLQANVARADVAPFLMGADLPDFTLTMADQFSLDGKKDQAGLSGDLTLDLRNLAQWKPELANIGSGTLKATIKTTVLPNNVELETVDATFAAAGGRKLLDVKLQRKFSVQLVDGKPRMSEQPGELLSIALSNLPVEWLAPFSPAKISGGNISGAATLSASSQDSFSLQSSQPWTVGQLSVSQNGQPVLASVDVSVRPDIAVNGDQVTVKLDGVQLTNGGKTLAAGNLDISSNLKDPATQTMVTGKLNGDLAKLEAQPVLNRFHGLAGGNYDLTADLKPGANGAMDVDASLQLSNLTLRESYDTLAGATLSVTGSVKGADSVDLQGPLTINGMRASSAQLVAQVDRSQGGNQFNLSAKGDTLVYDDLMFLQSAISNPDLKSEKAKQPGQGSASEPDKVAAWHGNEGKIEVQFAQVYWGSNLLTGFDFGLDMNAAQLDVSKLAAQLNGAPVNANAKIDFQNGKEKPYVLDASLDLEKLEVGSLLAKDGNPQNASVTGEYTIKGTASGAAPTLNSMTEFAQFQLDLKGGPGVVRSLKSNTAVSATAGLLGTATGLAGLIGGDTVQKNPGVATINSLLNAISKEIEYEKISFVANRGADLNANLQEFLLFSPENSLKFKGAGQIKFQENTPLAQQPMLIRSELWVEGDQAEVMNKLKLLGSQKDADGYQAGPKFDITGSLSQPDYYSSLARTLLSNVSNIVGGLVGGAASSAANTAEGVAETAEGETGGQQQNQAEQEAVRAVGGLLQGILNQQKKSQDEDSQSQ